MRGMPADRIFPYRSRIAPTKDRCNAATSSVTTMQLLYESAGARSGIAKK